MEDTCKGSLCVSHIVLILERFSKPIFLVLLHQYMRILDLQGDIKKKRKQQQIQKS